MGSFWSSLLLYSVMIAASVVVGSLIPYLLKWKKVSLHFVLSFSAGLMLGATLIHLLPESFEIVGKTASLWTLAGFLLLYLFQKFFTVHLCDMLECEVHSLGVAAIVGISIHSLTDGVAMGSGLLLPEIGFVVFLTIFFHKLPEAFSLTAILLHEKHARARILFFNFLIIAMVPIGASLVHWIIPPGNNHLAGIALAFAAGTFLHISLSDLLPHVHEHAERQWPVVLSFGVGLGLMFLLEHIIH